MPIARRLQALLEPFVAQAEPLRETWDRFFQETSVEDFVMKRAGTTLEKPLEQAGITLRYLGAHNAAGYLDPERNSFFAVCLQKLSQLQLHLPDIPMHKNRRKCKHLQRFHTCQHLQRLRPPDMRPYMYRS